MALDQRSVRPCKVIEAHFDFVDQRRRHGPGPDAEDGVIGASGIGSARWRRVSGDVIERSRQGVAVAANRQAVSIVDLPIGVKQVAARLNYIRKVVGDAAKSGGCVEDGIGLALPFICKEKEQAVFQDGPTECYSELLVGKRKDAVGHGIGRIEITVAK